MDGTYGIDANAFSALILRIDFIVFIVFIGFIARKFIGHGFWRWR